MDETTKTPVEADEPENQPQPQAAPVTGTPPEETVGDIMGKMQSAGLKWLVIVASALVYAAGIVYAEVHGINMLQRGVAPDMRIWATMGMIAAGISAVVFPIALKVWTIEARHRLAAFLFYFADFAFLIFNAVTDFDTNTGGTLAPWAQTYVTYILPASPIVIAGMWSILWNLDPDVRDAIQRLNLRAAMKQKVAQQVAEAAKGANVTAATNAAAQQEVDRALWDLFGAKPASGYYVMDEAPKRRVTLTQRFFDGLLGLLSYAAQLRQSNNTPTQSQPSDSPND